VGRRSRLEINGDGDIWNSLPTYAAEADSVNAFKNRLDKYWINLDVCDDKSDLTGRGLPVCA